MPEQVAIRAHKDVRRRRPPTNRPPPAPPLTTRRARLLLVRENFLQCSGIFHGSDKRLDKRDIERIFSSYDRVSVLFAVGAPEAKLLILPYETNELRGARAPTLICSLASRDAAKLQ